MPVFTRRALSIALACAVFLPLNSAIQTTSADAKTRKPSIAEINEAKKKEAEKKAAADQSRTIFADR